MIGWYGQNLTALGEGAQATWRRSHLGLIFQISRLVSVMSTVEHLIYRKEEDLAGFAREAGLMPRTWMDPTQYIVWCEMRDA
jgi:predicted ABC-type transport system involved in lysophospholipase L1 biosynthesis ATPase subunit